MAEPTMSRYRKKPVVIDAMRFTFDHATEVAKWCSAQIDASKRPYLALLIDTLEGTMRADLGDWIIKGVKGEFHPCKPDIFEATYEEADVPAGTVYGIEPGTYDARTKRLAEHLDDRYLWVLERRRD